jgi:hypothetical protein
MTQEQLLKDTINYYSANPAKRRCISNRSSTCYYSPEKAKKPLREGCAIGRHLAPKTKIAFDALASSMFAISAISAIMEVGANKAMMPDWMQKMNPEFLRRVQGLHDWSEYWDVQGLTRDGKERVNDIINYFRLSMDRYTK